MNILLTHINYISVLKTLPCSWKAFWYQINNQLQDSMHDARKTNTCYHIYSCMSILHQDALKGDFPKQSICIYHHVDKRRILRAKEYFLPDACIDCFWINTILYAYTHMLERMRWTLIGLRNTDLNPTLWISEVI